MITMMMMMMMYIMIRKKYLYKLLNSLAVLVNSFSSLLPNYSLEVLKPDGWYSYVKALHGYRWDKSMKMVWSTNGMDWSTNEMDWSANN